VKNYPQILKRVYGEPWAIRREQLSIIQRLVESRILGVRGAAAETIEIVGKNEPEQEVEVEGSTVIIPVHGTIGRHLSMLELECGGCDLKQVEIMMDDAERDSSIARIVFDFNTPGGTVTGVPELAARIRESQKECVAFTDSQCCSAGYWLASQCREFYCTGSSEVGSIGVWMAHFDYSRQLENDGVRVTEIKAGEMKTLGAPWRPMTEAERSVLQAGVNKVWEQFKDDVRATRSVQDEDMEGQVFDGDEAVSRGLASGLVDSLTEILDS